MRFVLMSLFGFLAFITLSAQSFICGVDSILDIRDGKKYATVQIGSQCWMQQNLNYGRFVASTTSAIQHSDVANNSIVEKYCQNNDSTACDTYGGLYDWNELMNYSTIPGTGICPSGWHVPTDPEFTTLVSFAGNNGNALKMLGVGMAPNGIGTNTTGFSALGGGDRDGLGVFYGTDLRFIFWTGTQFSGATAWQYTFFAEDDSIAHLNDAGKQSGFSLRCLRDIGTSGLNDALNGTNFMLFPNPTSEVIKIQNLNSTLNGILQLNIYSLDGKLVRSGVFQSLPVEMDVKDLEKGLYLFEIKNGGSSEIKKIVIN